MGSAAARVALFPILVTYRGGSRIFLRGGPNGYACCMAVAAGRVPLKRLPCVHIYIFVAFAPFHSHQIFAKVCMQGGSNLDVL